MVCLSGCAYCARARLNLQENRHVRQRPAMTAPRSTRSRAVLPVYNEADVLPAALRPRIAAIADRAPLATRSSSSTTARATTARKCSTSWPPPATAVARGPPVAELRPPGGRAGRPGPRPRRRRRADGLRHAGRPRGHCPLPGRSGRRATTWSTPSARGRKERLWKRCLVRRLPPPAVGGGLDTPIPADAGNFGLIDRRVAREIVRAGRERPLFSRPALVGRLPAEGDRGRAQRPLRRPAAGVAAWAGAAGQDGHVFVLHVSAGDLLRDRLRGAGASSLRWAAIRCSASCSPTWPFPAGRRTC